ncbi:N-acetyltransferase [bacterium]|nr:N-acetyltransferase [bacterium]
MTVASSGAASPRDSAVLAGEAVMLVPLAMDDVEAVANAMASDPEASAWWGVDASKIAGWLREDGVYPYRIVVDGETAGMVEFSEEIDPDYRYASIDIAMIAPYVGHGIGPEVLRVLLRWLFGERGHHRATIDPMVHNARAIRAYEKVGFKPVGVMRRAERDPSGVWRDNLLMDILAEEFG